MSELIGLTEKDLHCIARMLQEYWNDDAKGTMCLYCKFATECGREKRGNRPYFLLAMKKIEKMTGVRIYSPKGLGDGIFESSWIEKDEKFLQKMKRMNADERNKFLMSDDVWKYADNKITEVIAEELRKCMDIEEQK